MAISVTNTGAMRAPHNEDGHGLRNTLSRLRLLYGDDASMTLTDVSGETVASVTLRWSPFVNALLVDDERLARRELRRLLAPILT